jgi:hypothetical protein
MSPEPLEQVVRNVDMRLTRVEQILPTLATKDELTAEGERTRRYFDAVAERLEGQIQLLAEGLLSMQDRMDRGFSEVKGDIALLDRRVVRLEGARRA